MTELTENRTRTPRVAVVGEILYDVIDGMKHLGGAPFNFAFHLIRLGMDVRFISRVGNDALGKEMLEQLDSLDFPLTDIQTDMKLPTGTVDVSFDPKGDHTFNIACPVAYDGIEFIEDLHLPILKTSDILYFGTLAQRTEKGQAGILKFLRNIPVYCSGFYDINLRTGGFSDSVIEISLAHTDLLKLNTDELDVCGGIFSFKENNEMFISFLMERFHIGNVLVTRGKDGSVLYADGRSFEAPAAFVTKMRDSVGAGDAFAAMFCACNLHRWEPTPTLDAAARFAAAVCEIRGAIPRSPDFYGPFRDMLDERSRHESIDKN